MSSLFLLLFTGYLLGLLLPLCFPAHPRIQNILAHGFAGLASGVGIVLGVTGLLSPEAWTASAQSTDPFLSFAIRLDSLSSFFVLTISLAGLAISAFAMGYVTKFYGPVALGTLMKESLKAGVVTGRYPGTEVPAVPVSPEASEKTTHLKQSLAIREVDIGLCNAREMEMNALMNPVYDAERSGIHIAASPRHADALVVTGPVTVNMERALKDVHKHTPDPGIVIALGDCATNCRMFICSKAVMP